MTTLRQHGEIVRAIYGDKLTDKSSNWVHVRSSELCKLYRKTKDRNYVNECFDLNYAWMLKLLTNSKFRQGYTFDECMSEYYIKLDNIMSAFNDDGNTIYFCKYLELRMRGHLSNIRKQLREDLYIPLDEYYSTLPQ